MDIPVEVFNRQLEIINLKLRRELGMNIHSKNEHHIKEMWYIYNGILLNHKNKIMPFAAT